VDASSAPGEAARARLSSGSAIRAAPNSGPPAREGGEEEEAVERESAGEVGLLLCRRGPEGINWTDPDGSFLRSDSRGLNRRSCTRGTQGSDQLLHTVARIRFVYSYYAF
jgi:hypothetical protein